MTIELIYAPSDRELMLLKRCVHVTMGRAEEPKSLPSSRLLKGLLRARHSPIRVLQFGFLVLDIPSNTATHLARHVHAQPFISSLRNDRQSRMDGDSAPRNTPVDMIYYVNAEELIVIANKRLCNKAAAKTREVVQMMCDEAVKALPEIKPFLVPTCEWRGGLCPEIATCGKCVRG